MVEHIDPDFLRGLIGNTVIYKPERSEELGKLLEVDIIESQYYKFFKKVLIKVELYGVNKGIHSDLIFSDVYIDEKGRVRSSQFKSLGIVTNGIVCSSCKSKCFGDKKECEFYEKR